MFGLIRTTPPAWSWFDANFDRLFDSQFPRLAWEASDEPAVFLPRVDIRDGKGAIVVSAELPGIDKDGISIQVENGVLSLSGEKRKEADTEENGSYRSERVYGTFKRSFTLPEEVDPEKIDAEYSNGVLKLTLPKRPEAAPKLIAIKSASDGVKKLGVN
jgi:HSP20 family protein